MKKDRLEQLEKSINKFLDENKDLLGDKEIKTLKKG